MIAVDTNLLVRYAIKDDRQQAAKATDFLAHNRCFVLKTVLLECAWVLASPAGYNLPRQTVHERLLHILGLPNIEAEDAPAVAQALAWYAIGMDFADALHLSGCGELTGIATFDRKFAATAEKLDTLPSVHLLE
ncbi:MAG: type II toxin-antitoxin system VapC family toxin [Desulfuromonadales bacterium]